MPTLFTYSDQTKADTARFSSAKPERVRPIPTRSTPTRSDLLELDFTKHSPFRLYVYLTVVFILLCLVLFKTSASAGATAQVSSTNAELNFPIVLQIEATDEDSDADINFELLDKDFQRGQPQRVGGGLTLTIGNNVISSGNTVWQVQIIPKKAGQLTIPSFTVGTSKTQPITINVKKSVITQRPDYFKFESTVDKNETWVGVPVVFRSKLFYRQTLRNQTLTPLEVSNGTINQIGKPVVKNHRINGQLWQSTEWTYEVIADRPGPLIISSREYSGILVINRSGTRVGVRSPAVTIDVKPRPTEFASDNWLPLTNLRLTESWSPQPQIFRVGEPVTRTITFTAEANAIQTSVLENVELPNTEAFNVYAEPATARTLNNRASNNRTANNTANNTPSRTTQPNLTPTRIIEKTFTIIPAKAGEQTLPAVEIPWFNTTTGKSEMARLPARTVQVEPAIGAAVNASQQTLNQDNNDAISASNAIDNTTAAFSEPWHRYALIIIIALIIAWLLTLMFWWLSYRTLKQRLQNNTDAEDSTNRNSTTSKVTLAKAKQALKKAEPNISAAIITYANTVLNHAANKSKNTAHNQSLSDNITVHSLTDVASLKPNHSALQSLISQLNYQQYSNRAQSQQSNAIPDQHIIYKTVIDAINPAAMKQSESHSNSNTKANANVSAPLNPL